MHHIISWNIVHRGSSGGGCWIQRVPNRLQMTWRPRTSQRSVFFLKWAWLKMRCIHVYPRIAVSMGKMKNKPLHLGNPYFETNSNAVGHHFSDFQVPIWLPDTWFFSPKLQGFAVEYILPSTMARTLGFKVVALIAGCKIHLFQEYGSRPVLPCFGWTSINPSYFGIIISWSRAPRLGEGDFHGSLIFLGQLRFNYQSQPLKDADVSISDHYISLYYTYVYVYYIYIAG